jgi:hypothetical protein
MKKLTLNAKFTPTLQASYPACTVHLKLHRKKWATDKWV